MWTAFVGFLQLILTTLTNVVGNLGVAIILFTILTRLAMLPLTIQQLRSSRKMQELQPLMADLRRKYGKDQQKLTEEMTKLYRERKVNPAGGCLPLLIQLPIFIGVYQAVIHLVQNQALSPAVTTFLGISLGRSAFGNGGFAGPAYLILPVLSVVLQLLTSIMAQPKIQDPQTKATSQALMLMPLFFGYIGFTFNQGAVLYWVTGSLIAVIQQYVVSGFGSLTNYLPFLPERKGLFAPVAVAAMPTDGDVAVPEPEPAKSDFWTPLQKLTTATAGADTTEQAIADAKQQGKKKRR